MSKVSPQNAPRNCPDSSTATLRVCRGCGVDISKRRANAKLCASCSDHRQRDWNKRHYLLRHELDQHIDAIDRAAGIVAKLGNDELSGQLTEAVRVLRGER